jgi:signal transduction histidine kinase
MDNLFCTVSWNPVYLIFTSQAPSLLYYSHIPTAITSLFIGILVIYKSRKNISSQILFLLSLLFLSWSFLDLYMWTNSDSRVLSFFWSIINLIEMLVSILTVYFAYTLIEQRDVSIKYKILASLFLLPFLVFMPSKFNSAGFDLNICESIQGRLVYYFYFLELLFSSTLLVYLSNKLIKNKGEERRRILYISLGTILFLIAFSGTNIISSAIAFFTGSDVSGTNWQILQYGLFGMPVFMGFLAYLIVKYKAFNIKLLGAQALVISLITLIASEFFFTPITDTTNIILISVTVFLSTLFGIWLVNSVRTEVQRKEELQMMSEKLADANDQLRKLDNAKSEFISIASHQLRTPLTAIKGFVSLLLEGTYGAISIKVSDALNKVYLSNERMVQLVENLLNISRIESGRMEYQYQKWKVEGIMHELYDSFLVSAKKKGLSLELKLPDEPLPEVTVDGPKSREVISNLVDNALKYTKEGGVTMKAEFLSNKVDGDSVRVIISDTGIGVPDAEIPYLFAKFSRGKDTKRLNVTGTGLGLYVGKQIIEAQHGKLWVESEGEGKGSHFFVELPVSQDKYQEK